MISRRSLFSFLAGLPFVGAQCADEIPVMLPPTAALPTPLPPGLIKLYARGVLTAQEVREHAAVLASHLERIYPKRDA